MNEDVPFDSGSPERSSGDPSLVVDVVGFEGPLDLLLDLARRQRVDLHEISVLALAEQYLAFVETAGRMRLELAANYLVMAAWLAYLKSRLLLPEPPQAEGPEARDLVAALALRLRRLEAIREAARRLTDRHRLGRDIFGRGARERELDARPQVYAGTLHDLLMAYAVQRQRRIARPVTMARRAGWSVAEARAALERLIGQAGDWVELDGYLARYASPGPARPSVLASALSAALEMVREGRAVLRQEEPFAPLMFKRNGLGLRSAAP